MIKVIASDMDGTLLGDDHELAPQTIEAIHQAQDAGIRFIIATGRNYHSAMQVMERTDIVCDYLLSSGAEMRDSAHRVISRLELDIDLCEEIYDILKREGVSVIFCTPDYDYQIGTEEEVERESIMHFKMFYPNMEPEDIKKTGLYQKMSASTKIAADFKELRSAGVLIYKIFMYTQDLSLVQKLQKKLEINPKIAVASSLPNNLEITDIRAQKGPVLKEYIESQGYTMDEVMVFGDSMNDYSMLAMDFGATVAMGNSVQQIKDAAKYVTKSNEEAGVAFTIREMLKQEAYTKQP